MSHPIPLTKPDGTVHAYACGVCLCVHASVKPCVWGERHVAMSREHAAECCVCTRCKQPMPRERKWMSICDECEPLDRAERTAKLAQRVTFDEALSRLVAAFGEPAYCDKPDDETPYSSAAWYEPASPIQTAPTLRLDDEDGCTAVYAFRSNEDPARRSEMWCPSNDPSPTAITLDATVAAVAAFLGWPRKDVP